MTTQTQALADYLIAHGSITSREAEDELGRSDGQPGTLADSYKVIESEFTDGLIEKDGEKTPSWKNIKDINKRFSYGEKFQPLSGMNIRGGKALIPIEKYLAKPVAGFVDGVGGLYEK